jgi:uncharacterized protein
VSTSVWILALFIVASLSRNTFGASFDCAKASTSVEKMICSSPELSRLDDELGVQFKTAKARADANGMRPQFIATSREWLRTLSECVNQNCIRQVYEQRLQSLRLDTENAQGAPATVTPPIAEQAHAPPEELAPQEIRLVAATPESAATPPKSVKQNVPSVNPGTNESVASPGNVSTDSGRPVLVSGWDMRDKALIVAASVSAICIVLLVIVFLVSAARNRDHATALRQVMQAIATARQDVQIVGLIPVPAGPSGGHNILENLESGTGNVKLGQGFRGIAAWCTVRVLRSVVGVLALSASGATTMLIQKYGPLEWLKMKTKAPTEVASSVNPSNILPLQVQPAVTGSVPSITPLTASVPSTAPLTASVPSTTPLIVRPPDPVPPVSENTLKPINTVPVRTPTVLASVPDVIEASDLVTLYQNDSVATDRRFMGQQITIVGLVENVSREYVSLKDPHHSSKSVRCNMGSSTIAILPQTRIQVRGTVKGRRVTGRIDIEPCQVLPVRP